MADQRTPYQLIVPATSIPGKPDIARQLKDIFSNPVFSFTSDWQRIQTIKHPDLQGYESMVYEAIENPDLVMQSTKHNAAVIFETSGTGPYGRDLRVVVNYDSAEFLKGSVRGQLTTAYDRDTKRYPDPHVGEVIYSKRKGRGK